MTERPSSMSRWRPWSACCSSYSAPASCSTSRRCCAVASAESRLSACATNRSRTAADRAINWSTCIALLPCWCPERLDLGDTALVLRDDPRAAVVRDAEQRALELTRDPLQVLRPLLYARGVLGSGR
jgi:hypothetical protein